MRGRPANYQVIVTEIQKATLEKLRQVLQTAGYHCRQAPEFIRRCEEDLIATQRDARYPDLLIRPKNDGSIEVRSTVKKNIWRLKLLKKMRGVTSLTVTAGPQLSDTTFRQLKR